MEMEISWIGYPILFLALLFFIFYPKKLYELLIFSIPFTGTGLIQIQLGQNKDIWITSSIALGVFCLLRHLISVLHNQKIRISFRIRTPLVLLFLLAGVCCLSLLITPFIGLDIGQRDDYYKVIASGQSSHFHFELPHVLRSLYFVFGCFIAYYLVIKNDTYTKIRRSIQIYIYASFFVACWGLLEFILFYMDIPYPSFLLNQITESANHGGTAILHGRPRIVSATMESSIMSQQLLTAIPLLFFQIRDWRFYSNQVNLKFYFVIIIIVLALSTSTTATLGLTIFLFVLGCTKLRRGINIYIFRALTFVLAVVFLFAVYELYEKTTTTYSGSDRLASIERGLSWFLHYPVLGIGWGVSQVFDLIVAIATHLGLVGLLTLLLLLFSIYMNFVQPAITHQQATTRRALQYSLTIILIISEFSGFIFYCQYFWLVLGLSIAGSGMHSASPTSIIFKRRSKR